MSINHPYCIDIYHQDNVLDTPGPLGGLDTVKSRGIFALFHKASEGPSQAAWDPRYGARRKKWMDGKPIQVTEINGTVLQLPPVWGAYHFFHGSDPAAEARSFLAAAELEAGDAACCDWERVGASGFAPSADSAHAFCSTVEDALGRPIVVYGGDVPRENLAPNDKRWGARRLWGCGYGPTFKMPAAPFTIPGTPWLWQDDGDKYGPGPHTIPGVSNYCDNSTVTGPMTAALLHSSWSGA